MKKIKQYEIEGLTINIPLHYDEQMGLFIEDYPDFIEDPVWTKKGHRVLFSGTDACPFAEEATPGGCLDCGSCRFFKRADEKTWIGICENNESFVNKKY